MRYSLLLGSLLCLLCASCSTEYEDGGDGSGSGASQATRGLQETNEELASLFREACQCANGEDNDRCSFLDDRLDLTSCEVGIVNDNEEAALSYSACMESPLETLDACLSVCREGDGSEEVAACQQDFIRNTQTCLDTFDSVALQFARCPSCDPATDDVCQCINREGESCGDDELGCWCNDQTLGLEDGPALCVEMELCVQERGCSSSDVRAFNDACEFLTSPEQDRLGDAVALYDHMCKNGPAPGFNDIPVSLTCGFSGGNNSQIPEPACGNGVCESGENEETCPRDCGEEPEPESPYLFLLIDDETSNAEGPFPGADLDAVTLSKFDGAVHYSTAVEDFNIVAGEQAINPDAILGAPDDGCQSDETKMVSLGGLGGYIILSFATRDFDGRIENGDSIFVHEVGRTSCPSSDYEDEAYSAKVSVSVVDAQNGNFRVLTSDALGEAVIPVFGL